MTHADWSNEVVGRTGRVSGRGRFISGGLGARESALAASRVVLNDDQWIVEGADDEDEEICFNVDLSFEEVPSGWLERCRWNVSRFGRWTSREDILVLEARAWKQQQEQDAPPINEQAQSEACLARACVNSAPSETYQSTRSMSRHSSEQAALPYRADDSRYNDLTGYRQPSQKRTLHKRRTQPTEAAQSGACLVRACEYSASNETNQRACSKSKRNTAPLALTYSASAYRDDGYA